MNFNTFRALTICRRELHGYFASPLAYVFIVIFLVLSGFFTFKFGNFFRNNEANLSFSFFRFHPWLYLLLVPSVAMRLWAEEHKSGTTEILFTMPVSIPEAVIGKYLAAWIILTVSVLLTFPIVITTAWLGNPDYGVIMTGYFGTLLLAGVYLAIGSFTSSLTHNQVISFIISLVLCLLLILIGYPPITDFFTEWAPGWLIEVMTASSVLDHFETLKRGVIDLRDIIYLFSLIGFSLFATGVVLHSKRRA